jgi:hypothetical protein
MLLWNGGVRSGVEEGVMIGRSSLRASPDPCGHHCLGLPFSRICPSNRLPRSVARRARKCHCSDLLKAVNAIQSIGDAQNARNATPPARHRKRPGKADQASALAFGGGLIGGYWKLLLTMISLH